VLFNASTLEPLPPVLQFEEGSQVTLLVGAEGETDCGTCGGEICEKNATFQWSFDPPLAGISVSDPLASPTTLIVDALAVGTTNLRFAAVLTYGDGPCQTIAEGFASVQIDIVPATG
jgi:hypothetical protein